MGCTSTKQLSSEEKEAQDVSLEIDAKLRADKTKNQEIKILLLGAGESGKTTFVNQVKYLHTKAFVRTEDLEKYKPVITINILECVNIMIFLLNKNQQETKMERCELFVAGKTDLNDYKLDDLMGVYNQFNDFLLSDEERGFARLIHCLPDSVHYWFENLPRIMAKNYVPTHNDCIRSRQRTTGIVEIEFTVNNQPFRLVDVGGQKSERKKWAHCFDGVAAIIFCASLIDYDLCMAEDKDRNRLDDSLELFVQTIRTKWFEKSVFILFLNKVDLFMARIKKSPLSKKFDNFSVNDDGNHTVALKYMEDLFAQKNNTGRALYVHATTAIDTENAKFVFGAVRDEIVRVYATSLGF